MFWKRTKRVLTDELLENVKCRPKEMLACHGGMHIRWHDALEKHGGKRWKIALKA
jgi:hypothetical protein